MGVRNHFIFNGQSSLDYGVYIGGQGTYNAPQRDISKVSIPGRNGDLIMDNGRFLNVQVSYPIVVMDRFRDRTYAIRAWLSSPTTYARLEDTYHPDEYRMGMLTGGIQFETSAFNLTGKAVVTFDCKPQRFFKEGETAKVISQTGGVVKSPTLFPSKPLIRINMKSGQSVGYVLFGNQIVNVHDASEYVDVDCELMDCFKGTDNCNYQVDFGGGTFPQLEPGTTVLTLSPSIDSVEVTGRWWTV